jgi:hypothetical protein
VNVSGSPLDSVVYAITGKSCPVNGTLLGSACNDDGPGLGDGSQLFFTLPAGAGAW